MTAILVTYWLTYPLASKCCSQLRQHLLIRQLVYMLQNVTVFIVNSTLKTVVEEDKEEEVAV